MAKENKTKETALSVDAFYAGIEDEKKRKECMIIGDIMKKVTGKEAKMWGSAIVGFGNYSYKYESGREGDWFLTGFSPRKANLTLYLMGGLEQFSDLLKDLGKHKLTGGSCLYIKTLEDVDLKVLEKLISSSVKTTVSMHGKK